jgi:hypothetical protein
MDDLSYESNSSATLGRAGNIAEKRTPRKTKRWMRILISIIIVIIWGLIAFGGYSLARNYIQDIEQQLNSIKTSNQIELSKLNEQLVSLRTALDEQQTNAALLQEQFLAVEQELQAVKEEMSLAGDSLSTAAETKQALSERITDLSTELSELRKLIKRLEEAARVY